MASVPIKAILCLQLLYIRIGAFCVIGTDGISWDMEEGILRKRSKNRREFDYFKLSYLWPGTACRNTTRCCSCNACCRSKSPFEFTIHGLWPYNNDGTRPTRCSSNFDKKEISPLLRSLRKYWPSYNCEAASTCHWAHEWEKHGTCSYPVILDEFEYFATTLKVYHAHNVTGVLSEAGYKPSNSEKYPLTGITFAIQNAFHLIPELKCSADAVKELRICFSKDFQPRDCASASFIETGRVSSEQCPRYVRLPAYDRSWGNKQMAGISWKLFCAVHFLLIFTLF